MSGEVEITIKHHDTYSEVIANEPEEKFHRYNESEIYKCDKCGKVIGANSWRVCGSALISIHVNRCYYKCPSCDNRYCSLAHMQPKIIYNNEHVSKVAKEVVDELCKIYFEACDESCEYAIYNDSVCGADYAEIDNDKFLEELLERIPNADLKGEIPECIIQNAILCGDCVNSKYGDKLLSDDSD